MAHKAYDKFFDTPKSPTVGFNTIDDKMPMEGLWPWLRIQNVSQIQYHADPGWNEKAAFGTLQRRRIYYTLQSEDFMDMSWSGPELGETNVAKEWKENGAVGYKDVLF
jgi:hypothetical protein